MFGVDPALEEAKKQKERRKFFEEKEEEMIKKENEKTQQVKYTPQEEAINLGVLKGEITDFKSKIVPMKHGD